MRGRIRKKRKKQAYMEALERGNEYLKDVLLRQEAAYNRLLDRMDMEKHLTEMLLYASISQLGGSVSIRTEGLSEMMDRKKISHKVDFKNHMAHIEVKDKE